MCLQKVIACAKRKLDSALYILHFVNKCNFQYFWQGNKSIALAVEEDIEIVIGFEMSN